MLRGFVFKISAVSQRAQDDAAAHVTRASANCYPSHPGRTEVDAHPVQECGSMYLTSSDGIILTPRSFHAMSAVPGRLSLTSTVLRA